MAVLRSPRYPSLIVAIGERRVQFEDGVLETDDERVIERARRLVDLGVTVEGGEVAAAAAGDDVPRGNASRDEWAEYAYREGIAIGETWTRNEVRDAVRAALAETSGPSHA